MKRLWRWALRGFLALVVLLVLGFLLLDTCARIFLAHQIRAQTGFETKIGRVHIGVFHPVLTIENLLVYNPAQFGTSPFIDMPELHVEYDRGALFKNKLHFPLVRFNLARVNLVEDKNGRRNFDFLQSKKLPKNTSATLPQKIDRSKQKAPAMEFEGIDKLNLTLGKATYTRLGSTNQVDELEMNMHHQNFPNVKSEQDLYGLLFVIYLTSNANTSPGTSRNWLQLISPTAK